jgi:cell division protein FtsQ
MGSALSAADVVVVTDIYLAREEADPHVSGRLVADAVNLPAGRVAYEPDVRSMAARLAELTVPGDLVLTLGAGDVTEVGPRLLQLLALGGAAALGVAAWVVLFSSWLAVQDVQVVGTKHLAAEEITRAAAVTAGTPLARLDLAEVAERVEQVPGVAQARAERSWPRAVRITVVESAPVAVVLEGGTYSAMDERGVLFRELAAPPPRLPLVDADSLAPEGRAAALGEVAEVVSSLAPAIARRVDHVELSSVDSIVLALRDGDEVRWGSAESSQRKAQVLSVLLDIDADVYDVSVPEQPTTS